jgi:hypothetical protein
MQLVIKIIVRSQMMAQIVFIVENQIVHIIHLRKDRDQIVHLVDMMIKVVHLYLKGIVIVLHHHVNHQQV